MTPDWFWLVALLVVAASCGGRKPAALEPADTAPEVADITAEAQAWADSVSAGMTLRQKVSQMFMPALYASADYWTLRPRLSPVEQGNTPKGVSHHAPLAQRTRACSESWLREGLQPLLRL